MLLETLLFEMFVLGCTGIEDIINIHECEIEIAPHLALETLECLGRISQPKRQEINVDQMAL